VPTCPAPATAALLGRFDLIIAILNHILMVQGRASGVAQPRLILIWQRLTRLAARFTRAVLTGPTPRRSRKPATRPAGAKPRPSEHTIPTGFGWLHRLLPGANTAPSAVTYPAQQLRDLLADPEMATLIDTNPAIGRVLRPLFNALGLERPPILTILRPPQAAPSQPALPPPLRPPTKARTVSSRPATTTPPANPGTSVGKFQKIDR
jgi:hypothetical protein